MGELKLEGLKICKICNIEKNISYFEKKRARCRECQNEYNRLKYKENKYSETRKKYKNKNKEKIREYQKNYFSNRKKEDILFKLSCNLRSLISISFKNKKLLKKSKTFEILGCDYEFFKNYIEAQFTKEMNWDNIHFDHIKPVSTANTIEELYILNHYTNFQPLLAIDNIKKYNNLIEKQLRLL